MFSQIVLAEKYRKYHRLLWRDLNPTKPVVSMKQSSPYMDEVLWKYDELKSELKSIYEDKGKQAMFRAKCSWIENVECPTKYCFNVEKSNYNEKLSVSFVYKTTLLGTMRQ